MSGGAVWSAIAGAEHADLVVLVHGSMDRSAGMLRLSRRLDDRFRVLRYDRRGYGRSVDLPGPYTVDAHVADVATLIAAEGAGGRATLVVGHSFGGNVALALAERAPEMVGAVAVYETPLSWLDWWPGSTAGASALATADPGDAAESFMRRMIGDDRWERLPASVRAARRSEGTAMVAELTDLRRVAPWSPAAITVPVLALAGGRARPHHARAVQWIGEHVPGARRVVVDGAGHAGPNTHPDAVAAELISFLDAARGG